MALSANAANQNATASRILNKLNYALANVAEDIGTAATGDIVLLLDASDNYEVKYGDAANIAEVVTGQTVVALGVTTLTLGGTAIAATAAEINAAADVSARGPVAVTNTSTYAVLAANSGILHIIPDLSQDCTLSLPTAAAGLNYEFWYGGAAADASNFLIDSTGLLLGGVMFADHDAADAEIAPVFADASDDDVLTVVTPSAGTFIKVWCNGTNWYVNGTVCSATIPTFA